MATKAEGKLGFLVTVLLSGALAAAAVFWPPIPMPQGLSGICFPVPSEWPLPRPESIAINWLLYVATALSLFFVNRRFNFVPGTAHVLPMAFLMLCASSPWLMGGITAATLIAMVNVVALLLLFGATGSRNAAAPMFLVASFLSFGAMVQYAFLLLVPVYLLVCATLKILHWRSLAAFVMGLVAPFWIVIGLGIVSPWQLRWPELTNFFTVLDGTFDVLLLPLAPALIALLFIILWANNNVRLHAANSRNRAFNRAIVMLGVGAILLMFADYSNLPAYISTLALAAAVQTGNTFNAQTVSRPAVPLAIGAAICVILFMLPYYL